MNGTLEALRNGGGVLHEDVARLSRICWRPKMGTMDLTVVVLTKNESAHLPDLFKSVGEGVPVLVVDAMSTDSTVALARQVAPRLCKPINGKALAHSAISL